MESREGKKRGLSGREFQFELNWPRGKIICSIGRHHFPRDYCLTSTDHISRGILGIKNKSRTILGRKKKSKYFSSMTERPCLLEVAILQISRPRLFHEMIIPDERE